MPYKKYLELPKSMTSRGSFPEEGPLGVSRSCPSENGGTGREAFLRRDFGEWEELKTGQ